MSFLHRRSIQTRIPRIALSLRMSSDARLIHYAHNCFIPIVNSIFSRSTESQPPLASRIRGFQNQIGTLPRPRAVRVHKLLEGRRNVPTSRLQSRWGRRYPSRGLWILTGLAWAANELYVDIKPCSARPRSRLRTS